MTINKKQSGFMIFVVFVILSSIAISLLLPTSLRHLQLQQQSRIQSRLAAARSAALDYIGGGIVKEGFSAPGDPIRPDTLYFHGMDGEPDNVDHSGSIIPWTALCPISPRYIEYCIGQFPWKFLGLASPATLPNDPLGEAIWYAVPSKLISSNSHTAADLQRYADNDQLLTLTKQDGSEVREIVAIFAWAGASLSHQNRQHALNNLNQPQLHHLATQYLEMPVYDTGRHLSLENTEATPRNDEASWLVRDDVATVLSRRIARELTISWQTFDQPALSSPCSVEPFTLPDGQIQTKHAPDGTLPEDRDQFIRRAKEWARCHSPDRTWLSSWADSIAQYARLSSTQAIFQFSGCEGLRFTWTQDQQSVQLSEEGHSCISTP